MHACGSGLVHTVAPVSKLYRCVGKGRISASSMPPHHTDVCSTATSQGHQLYCIAGQNHIHKRVGVIENQLARRQSPAGSNRLTQLPLANFRPGGHLYSQILHLCYAGCSIKPSPPIAPTIDETTIPGLHSPCEALSCLFKEQQSLALRSSISTIYERTYRTSLGGLRGMRANANLPNPANLKPYGILPDDRS